MARAVSKAKRKEPISSSGTATRLDISFIPIKQTVSKPATIILEKSSKKLEMTLFILLSTSDNNMPSEVFLLLNLLKKFCINC